MFAWTIQSYAIKNTFFIFPLHLIWYWTSFTNWAFSTPAFLNQPQNARGSLSSGRLTYTPKWQTFPLTSNVRGDIYFFTSEQQCKGALQWITIQKRHFPLISNSLGAFPLTTNVKGHFSTGHQCMGTII